MLKVISSPGRDKQQPPPKKSEENKPDVKKPILMTRRELTDPFGSDDEEETVNSETIKTIEMNGDLSHKKDNNVLSELPKPNPVSESSLQVCIFLFFFCGKYCMLGTMGSFPTLSVSRWTRYRTFLDDCYSEYCFEFVK